ncbi:MAG: site-2 protease family protein [Deltaproteobacteria bacterium]|nr:site-2 protease family protein [Deltaproteobacteria bacterium]
MENILARVSIMLIPALLAVMTHEIAHGFMAQQLGDPTARLLGRLTLNPFKHIDPMGAIALLIFGFGWAKPVPINVNNLNSPRRDMTWVSFMGPAANLALACFSALVLRGLVVVAHQVDIESSGFLFIFRPVVFMAAFSLYINVILALFNLLPIPPLDGGRILAGILPREAANLLGKVEPFGFILVILLVFFTPFWELIMAPAVHVLVGWLAGSEVLIVEQVIRFLFRPL